MIRSQCVNKQSQDLHVNKRDFLQFNVLGHVQCVWSRCCDSVFSSAWVRLPCCLLTGSLKRDVLGIYLTKFSESVITKIQNLWGSSFVSKYSKSFSHFKNAGKNWAKTFCFWDNCIWIRIVKLFLLRTGYFSSVANVLASSPKIWHVNSRDFFQLKWLGGDH